RIGNRKNQALEAHTKSEALSGRAVEFFSQAVVTATPGYRVLGAKAAGRNLECCPSVVIQPAHKLWLHTKMDIPLGQIRSKFFKMATASVAQPLRNRREFCNHRLARGNFAIEYTKRIPFAPSPAVFAQAIGPGSNLGLQQLNIGGPAFSVADRVDINLEVGDT